MDDTPLINIVGVMSGSSLDGVDLACCSFFDNGSYRISHATTIAFDEALIPFLSNPFDRIAKDYVKACGRFDNIYGGIIQSYVNDIDLDIDMIVSHGHTIYHDPESGQSLQIGNGGVIASLTGIDILCDLRIQDVILGGQGAPLAALADKYLFADYTLMMNLGGIANISVNADDTTIAWDISPCNQVLNHLAQRKGLPYDEGGQLASRGNMITHLFEQLSSLPYFFRKPPKSLDNHWVQRKFIKNIGDQYTVEDASYTICHFIADRTYTDLVKINFSKPAKLLVTGGGANHRFLIEVLKNKLSGIEIEVIVPDPQLINYKEALLMAYMGYRYLKNEKNTVSSATGASKDLIAGALYRGNE